MGSQQSSPKPHKSRKLIASILVLVAIFFLAAGSTALSRKKITPLLASAAADNAQAITKASNDKTDAQAAAADTAAPTSATGNYKNGSYTAVGSYSSPGGTDSITIQVAVKDGIITDTSAQSGSTTRESSEYQTDFIAAYKSRVVGKKLSDIKLSRLSGSSLTPIGFNLAIDKIRLQAQA